MHRGADAPGGFADVAVGKMGVALGRGGIGMTEQAPDGVEVEAAHHGVAGERMAAVVDADIFKPGKRAELVPARAEVGHRPGAPGIGKDVAGSARQDVEDGPGRGCKLDGLGTGLAVGQDRARGFRVSSPSAGR